MKIAIVSAVMFIASYSMQVNATTTPTPNSYLESVLINVCKASKSDSLLTYNNTLKRYGLKNKVVARQVVCNGEDISDFARSNGAYKVAKKIERNLKKSTSITDIAALSNKLSVRFE